MSFDSQLIAVVCITNNFTLANDYEVDKPLRSCLINIVKLYNDFQLHHQLIMN